MHWVGNISRGLIMRRENQLAASAAGYRLEDFSQKKFEYTRIEFVINTLPCSDHHRQERTEREWKQAF